MQLTDLYFTFLNHGIYVGTPVILLDTFPSNSASYSTNKVPKDYTTLELKTELRLLTKKKPQYLCLGGGEPLLQIDGLKELMSHKTVPLMIITNGSLPTHLEEVRDDIHAIELRFNVSFEESFMESMMMVMDIPKRYIVYPLEANYKLEDIIHHSQLMASIDPDISVVIEPTTRYSGHKHVSTQEEVQKAYTIFRKEFANCVVIANLKSLRPQA